MPGHLKSMTYGELPPKADFAKAFKEDVPRGKYKISGPPAERADIAGEYDVDELYDLVKELKERWEEGDEGETGEEGDREESESEEAGDWASAILATLGFEWV